MSNLFNLLIDQEQRILEQFQKLNITLDALRQLRRQTMLELKLQKIKAGTYHNLMREYDNMESNISQARNEVMTQKSLIRMVRGVVVNENAQAAI